MGRQTAVCAGTAPLPLGAPQAAFKRFSDRELVELKAEYPTLKRSQLQVRPVWGPLGGGPRGTFTFGVPLQEMIWRKWQKSAENPLNQPNARLGGP